MLLNQTSYAQNDTKARLITFWKLVGNHKAHNQIPKTIDDFIYGVISKKYPSLPLSEVMVRIETIDKYPAIQNDVLMLTYRNYAQGSYVVDKRNLKIVFDDMCGNSVMGNWVADYVIKKYATPAKAQAKTIPNPSANDIKIIGYDIPINAHENNNADTNYKPKFHDKDIRAMLISTNEVQFKNAEKGSGYDRNTEWEIYIYADNVMLRSSYKDGNLVQNYTVLKMEYDYTKQAQMFTLGTPAQENSVFHSKPSITHCLWLSWEQGVNNYVIELKSVDGAEYLAFMNNLTVSDLETVKQAKEKLKNKPAEADNTED